MVPGPIDDLRAVAASTRGAPPELRDYLEQVGSRAYTITDGDVEALKSACSEDEIFEQTVAVAIREGLRRLDAADEVIG